jgi:hypothetical protein
MTQGARTPEELEALFEDAFVTRDAEALCGTFAEGAVLAVGDGPDTARGSEEIGRVATALWAGDRTYVAEPRRVLLARDTAPSSWPTERSTCCAAEATEPGATRSRSYRSIPTPTKEEA